MQPLPDSLEFDKLFWSRVQVNELDECWPWMFTVNAKGYGQFSYAGRHYRAYVVAYCITHSLSVVSLTVMHSCDNPPCCNPKHLSLGTTSDNIRDAVAKGRTAAQKKTHCPHGHKYTKANTYIGPTGGRRCRQCNRDRWHNR